MRLATVLTPITDEYLQLAAQCGVVDVTIRYPGAGIDKIIEIKDQIERFGLRPAVMEGALPIEHIKLGSDRKSEDFAELRQLLADMSECEIPVLCYNFMAGTDWVRTSTQVVERGGAWVTEFNAAEAERAVSLDHRTRDGDRDIGAEELWRNLQEFLEVMVPVAEQYGISLAMHPDDPPLDHFAGKDRIMNRVENFDRLLGMAESNANGICFCQGTFAEMGADIPASIRHFGDRIHYVHFRDIVGTADNFRESFHDNGQTDMYKAMQAYADIGFQGPMRPDHVPQLVGEEDGEPGYTMLGRLYAYGYMKGLMDGVQQ